MVLAPLDTPGVDALDPIGSAVKDALKRAKLVAKQAVSTSQAAPPSTTLTAPQPVTRATGVTSTASASAASAPATELQRVQPTPTTTAPAPITQPLQAITPKPAVTVPQEYQAAFDQTVRDTGAPANMLAGLFSHESGWNADAYNAQSGASGLGQFLESTAQGYGTTGADLRRNPDIAIRLTGRYLSDLSQQFGGDWQKAFAAYFIGPGNVQEAVNQGGANWLQVADRIAEKYGQGSVSQYLGAIGAGSKARYTSTASAGLNTQTQNLLNRFVPDQYEQARLKPYLETLTPSQTQRYLQDYSLARKTGSAGMAFHVFRHDLELQAIIDAMNQADYGLASERTPQAAQALYDKTGGLKGAIGAIGNVNEQLHGHTLASVLLEAAATAPLPIVGVGAGAGPAASAEFLAGSAAADIASSKVVPLASEAAKKAGAGKLGQEAAGVGAGLVAGGIAFGATGRAFRTGEAVGERFVGSNPGGYTKRELDAMARRRLGAGPVGEPTAGRQLREVMQATPDMQINGEGLQFDPAQLGITDSIDSLRQKASELRANPKGKTAQLGRVEAQLKALEIISQEEAPAAFGHIGDEAATTHGTSPQLRAYITEMDRIHNAMSDETFTDWNWNALKEANATILDAAAAPHAQTDLFGGNVDTGGAIQQPAPQLGSMQGEGFRGEQGGVQGGLLSGEANAATAGKSGYQPGLGETGVPAAAPEAPAQTGGAQPPEQPPTTTGAAAAGGGGAGPSLDSIRVKFLRVARQEENLRRLGAVQREIRQGRAAQASGVRAAVDAGGTPEEIAQAARQGMSQGGTLRRTTLLRAVQLSPQEKDVIYRHLGDLVANDELSPFDYYRLISPSPDNPGIIAKLTSDKPQLQPNEVRLLRDVFGDEFANAVAKRSAESLPRTETLAEEARLREQAAKTEARQIEKTRQAAAREEQRINQQMAREQERIDARDLRQLERERQKAIDDFNKADQQEIDRARRWADQAEKAAERRAAQAGRTEANATTRAAAEQTSQEAQQAVEAARSANPITEDSLQIQKLLDQAAGYDEAAHQYELNGDAAKAEEYRQRAQAARDRADRIDARQTNTYNQQAEARQLRQQQLPDREARDAMAQQRYGTSYDKLSDAQKLDVSLQTNAPEATITNLERRVQERWDAQNPNEEMLRRKLTAAAAAIGQEHNVPAVEAVIYATKKARATLDLIGTSPGAFHRMVNAVRAGLTGDAPDAYVTTLLRQEQNLRVAMTTLGATPEEASAISRAWRAAELKARFPRGVPDRLAEQFAAAGAPAYQDALGGLEKIVQTYKNVMFSTDFGVFGVQVQAAFDRDGIAGIVGLANRLATVWQLPHAELYSAEVNLPKRVRNVLDGLHDGVGPSPVQTGTTQGTLGPVNRVLDWMNEFQFRTVLGNVRQVEYEGNLTILRLLGRDIADPRVRAIAADFANASTSFSPTALNGSRAAWERMLLTSPTMTRSEVANLLQMSKFFRPTASIEERILAGTLIASRLTTLVIKGTVLNNLFGVGQPMQWDPRKPGFAQVTTRFKDSKGNNEVLSLVPQTAMQRAFVQALDALSQGDPNEAGWDLARAITGKSSFVGETALRSFGVGYDTAGHFHKGDLQVNQIGNILPVPPILQDQLSQNPGLVPLALDTIGENAFTESPYSYRNRMAQQQFGQPYKSLLPSQQTAISQRSDVTSKVAQQPLTPYQQNKQRRLDQFNAEENTYLQAWKDGTLTQPLPDLLHDLKARRYQTLQDLYDDNKDQWSGLPEQAHSGTLDGYFSIEVKNSDGTINWDQTLPKRDAYMAGLAPNERTWLQDWLGNNDQQKSQIERDIADYNARREAAGYYRDGITQSEKNALDRANPQIDAETWLYYGGAPDQVPALQSAAAVNIALQMIQQQGLQNRQVKYDGLSRPINESDQTLQAWQQSGSLVDSFLSGERAAPYRDKVAQALLNTTYDAADNKGKERVDAFITSNLIKNNPDLDAWLAWWGRSFDANGDALVHSAAAGAYLKNTIRPSYGKEPFTVRYASNVR